MRADPGVPSLPGYSRQTDGAKNPNPIRNEIPIIPENIFIRVNGMKKLYISLVFLALVGIILVSGCTSTPPAQTVTTVTSKITPVMIQARQTTAPTNALPTPLALMGLQVSDLPQGFNITHTGGAIQDMNCSLDKFCQTDGYSVSVDNGNTTPAGLITIDQEIMVYTTPVNSSKLVSAFNESYPELSGWVTQALPAPGIGNVSLAYRYTAPNRTMPAGTFGGYVIVFGNGEVYEILKSGSNAPDKEPDYLLLKDLAGKAAAKIPSEYSK